MQTEYMRKLAELSNDALRDEYTSLLAEEKRIKERLDLVQLLLARDSLSQSPPHCPAAGGTERCITIISENDLRYGLIRFRKDSLLARKLPRGEAITVRYANQNYRCTVPALEGHPGQRGRINGLTKVYRAHSELRPGSRLWGAYDSQSATLSLTL